ncbi:LOW QUALITY PROTEIN: proton-coupled amino acid transporter-like protein pathetic [Nilaparvata lugens]|uniref:LOW QUALITY PROTEIN: proton-coupled amino acid transporter-like protein pathetic n=1 Tax=Nilaparvata lugens TaxID=108931 RepID=UPI00193CE967|nr:LOW QUALITY PROTEIN: proton-coupled amino acid transporter-like protein pathetic [Nilaparvata lugens]
MTTKSDRVSYHDDNKTDTPAVPEKIPLLLPTIKQAGIGDIETLVHLLKSSLGTGILAMPMAFKNAGLIFGLLGTFFIGYICTYCVHMFVKCAQILCERKTIQKIGFQKVVELSFLEGPKATTKFSTAAGKTVMAALLMELLGCCCAYVVFVAKSMKQLVDHYGGHEMDVRFYMLLLVPCLITTNMGKSLRFITPISVISNSLFMGGVGVSYYYIFDDLPSVRERPWAVSWHHWPKFFGTAIFAMEGIGTIMPIENSMKTPKHFIGCPGVLNIGMIILVTLYSITGFFGFLKYGAATDDSITFNLPTGAPLAQVLKIVIALGIFLSYSLLFFASIDLLRDNVLQRYAENSIRIWLIVLTVVIAALFPNLGPFLTLVGALSLSIVGLIFPPICEVLVYWHSPGLGRFNWRLWKNILIVCFGIVGLITGTMTSISEFARAYRR